jgi:putative thioredoxin
MNTTQAPAAGILDTTTARFAQDVLEPSRSVTVAVDFWAPWCGPCRALAPVLEQLVLHYGGRLRVARVNIDEEPAIAQQFGIRSIPDVRVFRDGRMVDGFVGAQPLARVQALFDKYVPRASEQERMRARDLLRSGDAEGAAALLRGVVESDTANTAARIDLADALARLGDIAAAESTLAALPANENANPAIAPVRARLHFQRDAPAQSEIERLRKAASREDASLRDLHRLAAHELLQGDAARGLELLLSIMQRDRKFEDDLGRRSLLEAFSLLGEDDERVKHYRRQLARLLY